MGTTGTGARDRDGTRTAPCSPGSKRAASEPEAPACFLLGRNSLRHGAAAPVDDPNGRKWAPGARSRDPRCPNIERVGVRMSSLPRPGQLRPTDLARRAGGVEGGGEPDGLEAATTQRAARDVHVPHGWPPRPRGDPPHPRAYRGSPSREDGSATSCGRPHARTRPTATASVPRAWRRSGPRSPDRRG